VGIIIKRVTYALGERLVDLGALCVSVIIVLLLAAGAALYCW
jgi:hypothetical protein